MTMIKMPAPVMPRPTMPAPASPDVELYRHESNGSWLAYLRYGGNMLTVFRRDDRETAHQAAVDFWRKHTKEGQSK